MSHDRFAMADLTGGETNAIIKMVGGAEEARAILRGEKTLKVEVVASKKILVNLLEEVGESGLPAHDRFVARDKLVVDINGELPISSLGDNLKANFLDLVEENIPSMTAKQRKLLKRSVDGPIVNALGDTIDKIEKARTSLAHVFDFLKTADRNKWYIFYVADKNGNVWAVGAYWDDGGWFIGADSVRDPFKWYDGYRVVSR